MSKDGRTFANYVFHPLLHIHVYDHPPQARLNEDADGTVITIDRCAVRVERKNLEVWVCM